MRRITLDTNIYISAFQFGGQAAIALQMALDGDIELAVSQPIIDETMRVLRSKFGWQTADLDSASDVIHSCTRVVSAAKILDVVLSDPDDNRIVECAVAAGSETIVTGDKHLLELREYEGISIVRLREFLL